VCAAIGIGEAGLNDIKAITAVVEQTNTRIFALDLWVIEQIGADEITASKIDVEIEPQRWRWRTSSEEPLTRAMKAGRRPTG
jgi:hypothetical protein